MKITAMIGAGALAAATLTATVAATPADAQRRGWDGYRHGPGWNRGHRGWRGDRHWRGDRRWRAPRYYGGYRPRTRLVCRWQRGYYGPVRRCFRVWR